MSKKKKSITLGLTEKCVQQLDELVTALNISRSAVIAQAIARFWYQEPLVRGQSNGAVPKRRRSKKDGADQPHV